MPREIRVRIKIPMPMRELTKAVVRTLEADRGPTTELAKVLDERLVSLDIDHRTVGSYRRPRR